MKRTTVFLSTVVTLLLSLASCMKESDVLFTATVLADLDNSTLVGDNGVRYNITNMSEFPGLDTLSRVVAVVYANKEISETEYEGTIYVYAPVLVKDYLTMSTMDADKVGEDAVNLNSIWVDGKYISVRYDITSVYGSKTVHTINLVHNDAKSNKDTVFFELRHNAFGESYEYSVDLDNVVKDDGKQYVTQTGYASFPRQEDFIKDGQVVRVDFEWLKSTADGYLMPVKKKYDYTGTYKQK